MRKLFVFSSIMVLIFSLGISVNSAIGENFPSLIPLPDGFRPEGVVVGKGLDIYAGSLEDGSIYRADLRTGQGEIVVPRQDGTIAVGLSFDRRSNFLFVAGGPAGAGYVYDVETGAMVAEYQLTTEDPAFINDVIVTRSAAYFTDSFRPFFYRIPLGPAGELPDAVDFEEIPLTGDFVFVPGAFNANGIDATPNGKSLLIVNSTKGELYHVEPETGIASMVDLGGPTLLGNGDGILLDGMTLYVVQNRLNQIAVVQFDDDLTAGEIVATITSPYFDVPTTITEFGNFLYLVNARFGTAPPEPAPYDIVKVAK